GRFRRARARQADLLVVSPAAQVERVARLEPTHAVLDRLPRTHLGTVVLVVALAGIDEISRALLQGIRRGNRQRPHWRVRRVGRLAHGGCGAEGEKESDAKRKPGTCRAHETAPPTRGPSFSLFAASPIGRSWAAASVEEQSRIRIHSEASLAESSKFARTEF